MDKHEKLRLRDPKEIPTGETLKQTLGSSYAAYETFQDALPGLDIEQEWQWYTPYKAWFARGQYFWITAKGTKKTKNLYWLYVYEGSFCVAVWFKEKNRKEVLKTSVSEKTKQMIRTAETKMGQPTFPAMFDITNTKPLADIYTLIECKKRIEA